MILCNNFVNKKLNLKSNSSLLKTGIIIGIGLTIHNLPEGLAIGSGFEASKKLGLALAIAICIHDFPEGISMAVPLKQGGFSKIRVILYTTISGISTGVGALLGALIGNISTILIGFSLSFAARSNALHSFL
jgi:ZIP family zinc transporter